VNEIERVLTKENV